MGQLSWEAPHHCAGMQRTPAPGANDPLVGGSTVQGTDANVHSLDGYTCQGTPSLIDGPQIKPSHQVEPPVHGASRVHRGCIEGSSRGRRGCIEPLDAHTRPHSIKGLGAMHQGVRGVSRGASRVHRGCIEGASRVHRGRGSIGYMSGARKRRVVAVSLAIGQINKISHARHMAL